MSIFLIYFERKVKNSFHLNSMNENKEFSFSQKILLSPIKIKFRDKKKLLEGTIISDGYSSDRLFSFQQKGNNQKNENLNELFDFIKQRLQTQINPCIMFYLFHRKIEHTLQIKQNSNIIKLPFSELSEYWKTIKLNDIIQISL